MKGYPQAEDVEKLCDRLEASKQRKSLNVLRCFLQVEDVMISSQTLGCKFGPLRCGGDNPWERQANT